MAGEQDPLKGDMVGYAMIMQDGSLSQRKSTTVRGLASQQFDYSDQDYLSLASVRKRELDSGSVVDIRIGKVIRQRPKVAGL